MNTSKDVDAYIKKAPKEQQERLWELRRMIEFTVPDAAETMGDHFPVYTIRDEWLCGFACRAKGVMFYLMNSEIIDEHKDELGSLVDGESCLKYKATKDRSLDELRDLYSTMLRDAAEDMR